MSTDTGADGSAVTDAGGNSGSDAKSWLSSVPESLRDNEVLKQFDTPGDAYESLIKLTAASKDAIRVPGDDASDEERAEFYAKLGRPEKPEGYEFQRPDLPDDLPYSEELEQGYKATAHKLGLNPTQAKGIYDFYNATLKEAYTAEQTAQKKAQEEAVEVLKKEWGDGYQANVESAIRAAEKFGGQEFKDFLDKSRLGDNPVFIKVFHAIGKAISDDTAGDTLKGGQGGTDSGSGEPTLKFHSMEKKSGG